MSKSLWTESSEFLKYIWTSILKIKLTFFADSLILY